MDRTVSRLLGELGGADPHDILGVPTTASIKEVEAAFRRRSKTLHPDSRHSDDPVADRDWLRVCAARTLLGRFGDEYAQHLRDAAEAAAASSDRGSAAPEDEPRRRGAEETGGADTGGWDVWAEPDEGRGYRDAGPTSSGAPPWQEPPPFRPYHTDPPPFRPFQPPAYDSQFSSPTYGMPHHPAPPPYRPFVPPHQPVRMPVNRSAIVALVASLMIAPLGLVLGVVALVRIGQTGERGRGLAVAALVIGLLFSLYAVVGLSAAAGVPRAASASRPAIETQVESLSAGALDDVRCPEDLPARVGAAVRCTATLDERSGQSLTVTVTAVEGTTIYFEYRMGR